METHICITHNMFLWGSQAGAGFGFWAEGLSP